MTTMKEEMMQEFILKQSEAIFLKHGYHDTTMDMIAEKCQLSKPTLYKYFPSKYELFMRLSVLVEHEIYHYLTDLIERTTDPNQAIGEIIDYLFRIVDERGDFFMMMMREHHLIVHENVDLHLKWLMRSRRELIGAIKSFVDIWIDPQLKKEAGLDLVASMLYNMMSGMIMDILLTKNADREIHKRFIIHLLAKGLMKEV